jgi:hypothetical protein
MGRTIEYREVIKVGLECVNIYKAYDDCYHRLSIRYRSSDAFQQPDCVHSKLDNFGLSPHLVFGLSGAR